MSALLLMLGAAAATAGVGATPVGDPGEWVTTSDYPAEALNRKLEGNTAFRLAIDSSGKPDACGILTSSGSQALDIATCTLLLSRARFKPALGPDGNPVRGRYSSRVRWVVAPSANAKP